MFTVPNVAPARGHPAPKVHPIAGDLKLWTKGPAAFAAAGLQWSKALPVDDGALSSLADVAASETDDVRSAASGSCLRTLGCRNAAFDRTRPVYRYAAGRDS